VKLVGKKHWATTSNQACKAFSFRTCKQVYAFYGRSMNSRYDNLKSVEVYDPDAGTWAISPGRMNVPPLAAVVELWSQPDYLLLLWYERQTPSLNYCQGSLCTSTFDFGCQAHCATVVFPGCCVYAQWLSLYYRYSEWKGKNLSLFFLI